MSARTTRGDAFGNRMKRAREAKGVSLREIAETTKLSINALEALERDDISKLPGGIFSRAFVRSYAHEVGLDPEQTVREFIEQFPHDWVTAGSPHVRDDESDAGPVEPNRRAWLLLGGLCLMAVVLGVVLFSVLRGDGQPGEAGVTPSGDVALATNPGTTSGVLRQVLPAAGEPLQIELLTRMPLTLEVTVDGVRQESRGVGVGERLAFSAEHEIELTTSDWGGLDLTINGQPAVTLGGMGEPSTVTINRTNIGTFMASQ